MGKNRGKKKKEHSRRSNAHEMTFARYVESDRSLDLPHANASTEVLTEYIRRGGALIEGHENEKGSGALAWRIGKVLNWLKERCDEGQLFIGGTKSSYIPPEFRTFSGEPMILRVHSIEEMETLSAEKIKKYSLVGVGTRDEDPGPPKVVMFHQPDTPITSLEEMLKVQIVAEIQVDPNVSEGGCERSA